MKFYDSFYIDKFRNHYQIVKFPKAGSKIGRTNFEVSGAQQGILELSDLGSICDI